ncbi:MAG: hypothetical protein NC201_03200 [Prevotella sp.]|nr:hypothetical protein [Bacteroides sp.]MCM1366234.1 hypothetical protein [Prevotella sp.]MCM1436361.1 hypothetical protein [Prevotella sp.]
MKQIKKKDIPGAQVLSPLQLNSVHFSEKHTRLTPEVLESMRNTKSNN